MLDEILNKIRTITPDNKRNLKNACYSGMDHLSLPLLWLISTPIFVKCLGVEVYGIWMLINGLFGVGGVLSLGLTDATVKFTAKYRAADDEDAIASVLQSTFSLYNALGFVSGGLVVIFAPHLAQLFNVSPEHLSMGIVAIRLGGVYVWARFVHSIFQSALHGFERYDISSRINMAMNISIIIVHVILVLLGFGLPVLILSSCIGFLGGACASAFILWKKFIPNLSLIPKVEVASIKEIMGFGVYTWIQSVISAIGGNLDVYLLSAYLDPSVVTYYTVGNRLAKQAHALLTRSFGFLFPYVSTLHENKEFDRLKRIYIKSTFTIMMLSAGIILPLFTFGESVLNVWMGAEFAQQVSLILKIMCVRYAVLPMGIVNFNYLRGTGMVRLQSIIMLITAIISFIAVWFLIPPFGLIGAAAGRLINIPLIFFTRAYVSHKIFGESDFRLSFLSFAPIAVVFAVVYFVMKTQDIQTDSILWLLPALAVTSCFGVGVYWAMLSIFRKMKLVKL